MVISAKRIQLHIDTWQAQIPEPRSFWAKYIFHSADAKTVVEILKIGEIKPRAIQGIIKYDVANQEVLARNLYAHNFSRFYFRPKTMFHLKTEGIRCLKDSQRPPQSQMSVPIVLFFDIRNILSMPNVFLTNKNFQIGSHKKGNDDAFFDQIEFSKVYNDAPTDDETRQIRMAEVVVEGTVPITDNLKAIMCRTVYDRATLLSLLSTKLRKKYATLIRVEQIPKTVFYHDNALFITDLKFYDGKLSLRLKHPSRGNFGDYKLVAIQYNASGIITKVEQSIPRQAFPVEVKGFSNEECYWELYLEDVLAFIGVLPSSSSSVV